MIRIRPWLKSDLDNLVYQANNILIWNNMKNYFPNPYTKPDGLDWLERMERIEPAWSFCIDFEGKAIGGVGFIKQSDVHCKTAEVGYWLGQEFWGRGFAAEALRQMTHYCFSGFDMERLYAEVFETNKASCRVLEKSGYLLESVKKRAIYKNGVVMDAMVFVRLRKREE